MFAGERPTRFYLAKEEPDLSMDPVTGMIRIRVPLDRETRDKYILSVEARNGVTTGYCQVRVERTRWDIVDETNVHSCRYWRTGGAERGGRERQRADVPDEQRANIRGGVAPPSRAPLRGARDRPRRGPLPPDPLRARPEQQRPVRDRRPLRRALSVEEAGLRDAATARPPDKGAGRRRPLRQPEPERRGAGRE